MRYNGNLSNYLRQERSAAVMMGTYAHYAISIGCKVIDDEIIVFDAAQSFLLDKKWKELTNGD